MGGCSFRALIYDIFTEKANNVIDRVKMHALGMLVILGNLYNSQPGPNICLTSIMANTSFHRLSVQIALSSCYRFVGALHSDFCNIKPGS